MRNFLSIMCLTFILAGCDGTMPRVGQSNKILKPDRRIIDPTAVVLTPDMAICIATAGYGQVLDAAFPPHEDDWATVLQKRLRSTLREPYKVDVRPHYSPHCENDGKTVLVTLRFEASDPDGSYRLGYQVQQQARFVERWQDPLSAPSRTHMGISSCDHPEAFPRCEAETRRRTWRERVRMDSNKLAGDVQAVITKDWPGPECPKWAICDQKPVRNDKS